LANTYFQFKQFTIHHDRCAMKVTTDGCLFGAWCAEEIQKSKEAIKKVLDIGCGTGLLSLMIAQKNKVIIDAVEIDIAAAEQAVENIAASLWKENISVINKDVLQWQPNVVYDCIVSNPPFYESELRSDKKVKNIAHHDEGLKLEELFRFVQESLSKNGKFFLLLPVKREKDVAELMKQSGFHLHQLVIVKQSINHAPFRLMLEAGFQPMNNIATKEIIIKDEENNYTNDFIALLKDYYLYL
jgi:tRNA1Val (adenine37-N6)-methyltransferase